MVGVDAVHQGMPEFAAVGAVDFAACHKAQPCLVGGGPHGTDAGGGVVVGDGKHRQPRNPHGGDERAGAPAGMMGQGVRMDLQIDTHGHPCGVIIL